MCCVSNYMMFMREELSIQDFYAGKDDIIFSIYFKYVNEISASFWWNFFDYQENNNKYT